jgi:mannose-6-phosphate isomerase-like protein (cupin superfamily)
MSRRGQVFENPVTGERAVVITDPLDHPEGVLVAELHVAPGGRVAGAHRHPGLVERFQVVRGHVTYLIGDREAPLGPGGSAEVAAGVVHDWWQTGDEEAVVVGEVDKKGIPHPLQLALSAQEFGDTMVMEKPSAWAQRLAFGVLAPIARARGLKPSYPEYLTSDVVVEPDPEALALIGEDGRLRDADAPAAAQPRGVTPCGRARR